MPGVFQRRARLSSSPYNKHQDPESRMKRVVQVIIAILFLLDVAIIVIRPIRWPSLCQFKRVPAVHKLRLAPVHHQIPVDVEMVPTPKTRAVPIFGNAFSVLRMALTSTFDTAPLIHLGLLFVLCAVLVSVIIALFRPVLVLRSTGFRVFASVLLHARIVAPVLILLCSVVILPAVVSVARVLILCLRMIIVVLRHGRKGSEKKQKQHDSRNACECSHADLRIEMRRSVPLLRMWSKGRAMLIRNPQIRLYETVFHLGFGAFQ
jgi:hypothetical protein